MTNLVWRVADKVIEIGLPAFLPLRPVLIYGARRGAQSHFSNCFYKVPFSHGVFPCSFTFTAITAPYRCTCSDKILILYRYCVSSVGSWGNIRLLWESCFVSLPFISFLYSADYVNLSLRPEICVREAGSQNLPLVCTSGSMHINARLC